MSMPTDEQLMERLQQGETSALEELYGRYGGKLYAFCCHIARFKNPSDCEDIVQDVFLRVINAAETFNPDKASFRTWMFRIARNHCIDIIRRREKVKVVPIVGRAEQSDYEEHTAPEDALADRSEDVERSMIRTSVIDAVRDCMDGLDDEEERQAIVLYYVSEKVYREIGTILGTSTSTAKNRVQSAQAKVKRCLERKGVDSGS